MTYATQSATKFKHLMANNEKDMLENLNRANKGELFILHFLTNRGSEVNPSELSAALKSSTARISALLGSLEKKGQIERNIDKNNRRNILVTITDAGRERAELEMKELDKALVNVFSDMSEADAAEFLRLTEQFHKLMHKHMSAV